MELNKTFVAACRAVHIYLTMLGLLAVLLFSVTGFTLNHPDWFGAVRPQLTEREARVPAALLASRDALRLVEHLRTSFGVTGALAQFNATAEEITLAFKAPAQTWDITIDPKTGRTTVRHEQLNRIALLNNLHRGRNTGPAWSWIIDLSAGLVVLASATGFVLWLALPRRRQLGVALLALGTLATVAVGYWLVPGADIAVTPTLAESRRP